jgi:hypothetical protein
MSLFEKLKNKINFKIFKSLDDPEAAAFAAEQAQKKAEENASKQKEENQEDAKAQREKELADAEANKPESPLQAAINYCLKLIVYGIGAFLVALTGSMLANTVIHRHPLIRILYFIFGSIIGLVLLTFALPVPPLLFAMLIIYFIMNWLDLLPHDYNFLPLIQFQPSTNIFYNWLQQNIIAWDPLDESNKQHYENKVNGYMDILKVSLAAVAPP